MPMKRLILALITGMRGPENWPRMSTSYGADRGLVAVDVGEDGDAHRGARRRTGLV
jgi:hypothetical protein